MKERRVIMKRLSLSGFQLKYIALITMVFIIHYFFEYPFGFYDWKISGPLVPICCD